jgi:hypothetical protein
VDEEESGNGRANQKRLRHFSNVQIPLESLPGFNVLLMLGPG